MTKKSMKPNVVDKIVSYFSPTKGVERFKARSILALTGTYMGASRSRKSMQNWNVSTGDANADILYDLPLLRQRSLDLVRNTPMACGIIKTKTTNVIGAKIQLQSKIDRDFLGLTEDYADAWEERTEREWSLFFNSKECDLNRKLDGHDLANMAYRQSLVCGDSFAFLPRRKRKNNIYDLKIQMVEAARVVNEGNVADTNTLSGGIEIDGDGVPKNYHVMKEHPGAIRRGGYKWDIIPAFNSLGLKNILHLYNPERPGQSRGVPDLTPVIEMLKQLTTLTDAELSAAVLSSFFTVFIESPDPVLTLTKIEDDTGGKSSDDDYKLTSGGIIGLSPGEKIHDTDPGRPNESFDPFVLAILRQIGAAVGLPYEILIKHFTASYSAARAALLTAWQFFLTERSWFTKNFHQELYKIWMYEAVAKGRIAAPGYLSDPMIRHAYLKATWVGSSMPSIDEVKEINAAKERVTLGVSTIDRETIALTGDDFGSNYPKIVKEQKKMAEIGMSVVDNRPQGKPIQEEGEDEVT